MNNQNSISRKLVKILRHTALQEGFTMLPGGFILVEDILDHFNSLNEDELIEIVNKCPKKRMTIETINEKKYIRASQGHSINIIDYDSIYKKIEEPLELCLHGTYLNCINSIFTNGLSPMKRTMIHMVDTENAKSGWRSNCEIIIKIDMENAMKENIVFYKSENNVILTPSIIPPKFLGIYKN